MAAALSETVSEDRRIALAAQLPLLRPAVFTRIIDETARANASFALTTGLAETIPVLSAPLNLGDMVVLTKNQLMMCYRIALAAGRDGEPRALMTEIIGVLGSGVLFRQAARSLVGLIPIVGVMPKVADRVCGHARNRAGDGAVDRRGQAGDVGSRREIFPREPRERPRPGRTSDAASPAARRRARVSSVCGATSRASGRR